MKNYLSLATAKQLKEWGCDIPTDKIITDDSIGLEEGRDFFWDGYRTYSSLCDFGEAFPTYDIRDIICTLPILESLSQVFP